MSTQNKKGTALITGASTGIGAIYADRLATRGYDLLLVARDQKRLKEVAGAISTKTGRRVETLPADLTKPADVARIEERLCSDASITALVNNAGVAVGAKLIESNADDLDSMIQLNVTALTRLTVAAVPGFLARHNGLLINIASVVALAPELLNGSYSGTKAYVVNFTQALAREVAGQGIQVQAVLPGATSTELWDRSGLSLANLPPEIVMSAEEMVDAALAGLDQQELITLPGLPEIEDWQKYEAARKALGPNLSKQHAAARYSAPN
jgi:short-subunit dehydrogenase